MSLVQGPAGDGAANVVDAVTPGSLVGKKALAVNVVNGGGDASEATLTTLLTEADFDARVGEVQSTPTANTLLARLKDIVSQMTSFVVARISDGAGTALTSTTVGPDQGLDVNIVGGSSGPTATEGAPIGNTGTPIVGQDLAGDAYFARVSPLGIVGVEAGDYAGDADRKLRVSEAHTIFSGKVLHDKQPLLYKEELTGAATSVFNANQSSVTLATVNASDKAIRQSAYYPAYQPNKSQKLASTFKFGTGVAGTIQSAGIFDANNGFIVRMNGTTPEIVLRSFTTGSVVETAVVQANWNMDKMDGTGPSGATIDFTKAQHFVVDYLWLGVGPARLGFRSGGDVVYVHRFNNDNIGSGVYMSTPTLPARWEVSQTGVAGVSMAVFCSAIESEGGVQIEGIERAFVATSGQTFIAGQEKPVLSLRLNSAHIRDFVKILGLGLLADDKLNAVFRWILNPTLVDSIAPTWVAEPDSAVEIDTTRVSTYTAGTGHVLQAGSMSDKVRLSSSLSDRSHPIGATPGGVSDVLVLVVKQVGPNNAGAVYPEVSWVEST